jgi:hypothetical protein
MVWFSCIDKPQNGISFIRSWNEILPLRGVKKEVFLYMQGMNQWDENLPNFVPSPSHTKFIPWDGFHLDMDKNNTHLSGLNFINF